MLAQPNQYRRATLNSISTLSLTVRQLAFFHLINYRQLKSQCVISLRSLSRLRHLTPPKSVNVFQDGSALNKKAASKASEAAFIPPKTGRSCVKASDTGATFAFDRFVNHVDWPFA
jgi:hypothetical protein